jgi:hypothetical protein
MILHRKCIAIYSWIVYFRTKIKIKIKIKERRRDTTKACDRGDDYDGIVFIFFVILYYLLLLYLFYII